MERAVATAALLALALAACQQNDPNNIAIDEGNSRNAEVETLPPDETVTNDSDVTGNSAPTDAVSASIPVKYHGRWGMVPADCTSTRGDAKGLIDVGPQTIKFFEAVATLQGQRPAVPESFSGLFAFTGEGQSWQKVMTFTRTGDSLKRAEEEGTFTYKLCA